MALITRIGWLIKLVCCFSLHFSLTFWANIVGWFAHAWPCNMTMYFFFFFIQMSFSLVFSVFCLTFVFFPKNYNWTQSPVGVANMTCSCTLRKYTWLFIYRKSVFNWKQIWLKWAFFTYFAVQFAITYWHYP